jgi:hypothetical protein
VPVCILSPVPAPVPVRARAQAAAAGPAACAQAVLASRPPPCAFAPSSYCPQPGAPSVMPPLQQQAPAAPPHVQSPTGALLRHQPPWPIFNPCPACCTQ